MEMKVEAGHSSIFFENLVLNKGQQSQLVLLSYI